MTYGIPKGLALATIFLVALMFAVPGIRHGGGVDQDDSFPVSRFTMFASPRPQVERIVYLRGVSAAGATERVPVREAWSGGMNAGWKRLNRLTRASHDAQLETCKKTAMRLRKRKRLTHLKELEIVAAHYDPREYFGEHKQEPRRERIVVRCEIAGREP